MVTVRTCDFTSAIHTFLSEPYNNSNVIIRYPIIHLDNGEWVRLCKSKITYALKEHFFLRVVN